MAIIIPGIAGEFYGSIGNVTFSKVASGFNIAKKKPRPSLSLSIPRYTKKTVFSQLVHHWKVFLTGADKTDWDTAAAAFVQSRHGVAYDVSGFNIFCGFNTLYFHVFSSILDAPTIFTGREGNKDLVIVWNGATNKVSIQPVTPLTVNEVLLVWWTDAQRPGATYRYVQLPNSDIYNSTDVFPTDLDAEYRAQDGTIFLRWIKIDIRGSYSFGVKSYLNYTFV